MKRFLESTIKQTLARVGVDIKRVPSDPFQMDLYRELYSPDTLAEKPFYNVGAGGFHHPFWTNIDYVSEWYRDMQKDVVHYDLMSDDPLPIEDDAAKVIYTSHTIEHIKEESIERFFHEAYRCLEPGGVIRVTCPDAESDYRALMAGDAHWFYWDEAYVKPGSYEHIYTALATSVSLAERWLHHAASPLSRIAKAPSDVKLSEEEVFAKLDELGHEGALDHFCSLVSFDPERPGNHVSWWTHPKVMRMLEAAGFSAVYRSGHGQSVLPIMRRSKQFDSTHPQMSLYVEAIK